jgi:putative transposase
VSELAAGGVPVAVTMRVLKLSRQPYYRWRTHPVTGAELTEAHRANVLFDAPRDDPEFGYRFLADEARDAGEAMSERASSACSRRASSTGAPGTRARSCGSPSSPGSNGPITGVADRTPSGA